MKYKKSIITLIIITIAMAFIKKENMTWRQSFMKFFYSIIMLKGKLFGTAGSKLVNTENVIPPQSFYQLSATANDGSLVDFQKFKGKKVIIVNTASNCGYTGQYDELQKVYTAYQDKVVVLGFPANDFRAQEKGTDSEIASFCKLNYGVSFPLFKKSVVIKNSQQNSVFAWLSNPQQNGWCNEAPQWNFSKYIVNENGVLTHVFHKDIAPLSKEFLQAIQ